jgi:hypothetical protein
MNRRSAILILALTLPVLSLAADDQWQIIKSGQFQGLANLAGEIIIPPVYDGLGWSDGTAKVHDGLIGYLEGDNWGLISIRNKKLTRPQFTILVPHATNRVKAAIKGKFSNHLFYGLLDEKGQVKIDFNYFSIEQFNSKLLLVSEYRERAAYYGLINESGGTILPTSFTEVKPLGEIVLALNGSKFFFFDQKGIAVFDFWLNQVEEKENGYLVAKEGRYGFIHHDGSIKYEVKFKWIVGDASMEFNEWKMLNYQTKEHTMVYCDSLTQNENGTWIAHVNTYDHLLSPSTTRLFNNQEIELIGTHDGFLLLQNQTTLKCSVYKENGEALLLNKDRIILDSSYMFALHQDRWDIYNYFGRQINDRSVGRILGTQSGLVAVRNHGYWGWMDFNGNLMIRYKYDLVNFGADDNQFVMQYIGKWGVGDFNDEIIIHPDYDKIDVLGKFYIAYKGSLKRVYNPNGELIYQTTGDLSGDQFILVREDSLFSAVLPSGYIVEPTLDSISSVSQFYKLRNGPYVVLMDSLGRKIIGKSDKVQDVLTFSDGWFLIKKGDGYGFIDMEGRLRIANRYNAARTFADQMAAIQLIGKWGFIDKQEVLKVQPFYDEVWDFNEGLAKVRIKDKYGIIDLAGREVIGLEWKSFPRQIRSCKSER